MDRLHVATALGMKPEKVAIPTTYLGGGFGRRATPPSDWVVEAAYVAKAAHDAGVNAPIKTVWTREDDLAGGFYRPMYTVSSVDSTPPVRWSPGTNAWSENPS